jgi:hypothetical protein
VTLARDSGPLPGVGATPRATNSSPIRILDRVYKKKYNIEGLLETESASYISA